MKLCRGKLRRAVNLLCFERVVSNIALIVALSSA